MGGSGGGGGSDYRLSLNEINKLRENAQERLRRSRTDADVNAMLQRELVQINDRDVELVSRRLDAVEAALRDHSDAFDRVLFGGSVAKHTYVDGLSDIDALVVLDDPALQDKSPSEVKMAVRDILARGLDLSDVDDIAVGRMAITLTYRDGQEVQLVPALERTDGQAVASETGEQWVSINPEEFTARLSQVNAAQAGGVVPAIKLAKAIISSQLPEEGRPSGYHLESLALAAFESYEGPRTASAMTQHFFEDASRNVLRPIRDVTGQSRYVDAKLGEADSGARQRVAGRFAAIAERMRKATSRSDWEALLHD